MVLAEIYISIFSDIIIAFTDTLGINMQIRHVLLLKDTSLLLTLSSLLPLTSKSFSRINPYNPCVTVDTVQGTKSISLMTHPKAACCMLLEL